jgi:RimJ/RimL family protein N-acetyltransferase
MIAKTQVDIPAVQVMIQPWSGNDLALLEKLMEDPEVMAHLGGPENHEKILLRHQRYQQSSETGLDHMFKIVYGPGAIPVGSIGYWEKSWQDQLVYETGWMILPTYQGRGIATKAAQAVIELARGENRHRSMHAFPAVDNPPSNAICRKLGFTLIGPCSFEYPRGNFLSVNDWRLDLFGKEDNPELPR